MFPTLLQVAGVRFHDGKARGGKAFDGEGVWDVIQGKRTREDWVFHSYFQQTWRERPRLPQTDSSVCSAPGRGIRLRQPSALPPDNASTNRGAANLEVHATS